MNRLAILVLAVIAAGCSAAPSDLAPIQSPSASTSSPGPSPSPSPDESAYVPGPNEKIPKDPSDLAGALAEIEGILPSSVEAWRSEGDPATGRPPRSLVLQVLYQQRIYRLLVRRPSLADRVLPRLGGDLRRKATRLVKAGAGLRSLTTPVDPSYEFKTGPAEPADELWRYYKLGKRRFDIDPSVLASVNMVETRFNRVRSTSSAGAQGPMQFLPSTWERYGMGGDIYDPHDAILGAANYLHASGAPADYRKALFAYNHADEYVDAVLIYSRIMQKDDYEYYVFYNWQAFAITTDGDKQLTGPGKDV
jgi:hypothetical protein